MTRLNSHDKALKYWLCTFADMYLQTDWNGSETGTQLHAALLICRITSVFKSTKQINLNQVKQKIKGLTLKAVSANWICSRTLTSIYIQIFILILVKITVYKWWQRSFIVFSHTAFYVCHWRRKRVMLPCVRHILSWTIHHGNLSMYWTPSPPHFYIVKLGFTGVNFFLIFALKHKLWVLVRTASMRRF